MSGYVKIFETILDSSIWSESISTRVVWITMLAMADAEGFVCASVSGLARRANVTREQCEEALAAFLAPDPDSKSTEFDGRRIEVVDGGWVILNHGKYREMKTKKQLDAAERARRFREKNASKSDGEDVTQRNAGNATVTQSNARNAPSASASASEDLEKGTDTPAAPERTPKPSKSPLTDRELSQLEVEGVPKPFVERVIQDWVTEPGDPHDLRFSNRWVTHAMKVVRGTWRDARRRREVLSAIEGVGGDGQPLPESVVTP
jgi:hypothetical protein